MPDEDDLKRMFESIDLPGGSGIDAKQVIRRSRARRLPKQLAAGAGGALVLVGVTVLGLQSVQFGQPQTTADSPMSQESSDSDGSGEADDSSTFMAKRAPADKLNLCGDPVADASPSQFGLVLDVMFPASAPAASDSIDGVVIMTNTGTEPVTGSTSTAPAITLSQDGIVLWHTNGPADAGAHGRESRARGIHAVPCVVRAGALRSGG